MCAALAHPSEALSSYFFMMTSKEQQKMLDRKHDMYEPRYIQPFVVISLLGGKSGRANSFSFAGKYMILDFV